ncbi:helix-turn-helix transcriptional regulator [Halorussus sp. MSC15.2]|uniref:helix-turn-helix transcriptional regulator n=1 Tax=Halorussus sp. MSC15.2 TaxID=2283638 RepID=UPI0013D859EE|nr:helix-turn-helix transcriptional regulator [Halorussus sp. MSC15.2]NEU56107.1 helix-turn-helix transcriptional regulator [Halorussus sp. MSC15.2]
MSDVGTEGTGGATRADPESEGARIAESERGADSSGPEVESAEASDAFEALGNEVRMSVLRTLVGDSGEGDELVSGRTMTFSELFEASPADTTAGFAYHLRQLTDLFLEAEDDEYALTYAGLQVARAISAGTYTDRVSFGPVATGDPCPLCESGELAAVCEANYVTVACEDCERAVLTLPFPPSARRDRDPERLLDAFDRHHRHRLSVMSDGVCPECAATMDAVLAAPPESVTEQLPETGGDRAQVRLDCRQCGCRLRAPVTLAVLEHPAVVSLFHDHALNVRDRPIWNVGEEWRETVVSDDPWCVRVSAELDDEVLDLFVTGDLSVAGTRRRDVEEIRQAS